MNLGLKESNYHKSYCAVSIEETVVARTKDNERIAGFFTVSAKRYTVTFVMV